MDNAGAVKSLAAHSSVCDVCQGFGDLNNPRGRISKRKPEDMGFSLDNFAYTYSHHENIDLLIASAEAGCGVCKLIRDGLEHSFYGSEHSEDVAEASASRDSAQPDPVLPVAQSHVLANSQLEKLSRPESICAPADLDAHDRGRITLQFYSCEELGPRDDKLHRNEEILVQTASGLDLRLRCFNSSGDPLDPQLEHRPSNDLLSEAHIGLINRWRHTCETEHESCNKNGLNHLQQLPSRVVELLDPSDETKGVRLVETHGSMKGRYVCLSYCWGDSNTQIGQTCRENLHRQLQGISFHTLPNTVVDAVHLCFKLGFRFLWVDRLCIVQDDMSDWSQEASKMCDVYGRSALTISVPLCEESSQSFLAERRKGFREQSQYSTITYTERHSELKGSLWIHPGDKFERNGPWFLECNFQNTRISPDYVRSRWLERGWTFQEWMLSPRVLHVDSMTLWDCFEGDANELNRRNIEEGFFSRDPTNAGLSVSWEAVVNEYSQRQVSHETDRLPALAGLAARYARARGHTYLAGLWLEEMPRSLLWELVNDENQTHPQADRYAPSWSWASVNKPVLYNSFPFDSFFRETAASITSFFCQYDPPDSFSAVVKAWIDVTGLVSIVTAQDKDNWKIKAGDKWWNSSALDVEVLSLDEMIAQANVYLLILGEARSRESIDFGALVLQRCGWEDGRQCFRRLGAASLEENEVQSFGLPYEVQTVRLV